MDILQYISKKVELVEREMERWVPATIKPRELAKAARHLLFAGGKRLRPCLLLISCEAVGGDERKALKAAVALELLHNFTLIHDDIMDRDEFRRNVKTVHVLWGEPMAIIAGDALFAKVFEALSGAVEESGCDGKTAAEVFRTVSRGSFEVCQGQAMDMELAGKSRVSEREYIEMIGKKTGALIEVSTRLGALLGKGSPKQIQALGKYGRLIGMAFQIRDDVLGITGEVRKFGKPVGSDIREGKQTLIVIAALSRLKGREKAALLGVLGNKHASEKEIRAAIEALKNSGSIDYAVGKAGEMVEEAKKHLAALPGSDAKHALLKIADFVIEREF